MANITEDNAATPTSVSVCGLQLRVTKIGTVSSRTFYMQMPLLSWLTVIRPHVFKRFLIIYISPTAKNYYSRIIC
jgi:hypothetical protein